MHVPLTIFPVHERMHAGPPVAPSNLTVSFLNSSYAFISWKPPFNLQGTKTWYRVYLWDLSSNNTIPFALACEGADATTFCPYAYKNTAVNGVCAEYRFAAEAENAAGASGQSAPLDVVVPTRECYIQLRAMRIVDD